MFGGVNCRVDVPLCFVLFVNMSSCVCVGVSSCMCGCV